MRNKLIVGITAPGSVGLLHGQLKYFKDLGYETYLLSPRDAKSEKFCDEEGCKLLEIQIKRNISIFNDIVSLFNIIIILHRVRPDIVNFGTPKIALLGLIAAKLCGIKRRVYTCRGFRFEHEIGLLKWTLMKMELITGVCANVIICISKSVMDLGVKHGLFAMRKCHVINMGSSNGIDLKLFNNRNISINDKQALALSLDLDNHLVFGFVGRLIDRKGISELYEAFVRIYNNDFNVRLLIIGNFDFDQIKDKRIAHKMERHRAIVMPGRTDNVPLYLSLMDIFVLPAWWEGFGNVLIQAAAMGIPVVSTNATGSCDAVKNGFNGILVGVKDVDQLEMAMLELKNNKRKRIEMGKNGIEWAKCFDNKIIWEGMNNLYSAI